MTSGEENRLHLDAQLGVLGSLLLDGDRWAGEVFLRSREDQYSGEYRTVFAAARRLHQEGKPIDPVTVKSLLGDEYTAMLLQLMELTPTAENCGAYLDLLAEQAKIARMQALGVALSGCRSAQEGAELLEECNLALSEKPGLRVTSAVDGYIEFMDRQSRKPQYIPWGFEALSKTVFSSLGDLVIIGGRPSAGKTALSLQMAWMQALEKRVGYFSLETNPDEIYDRLHSMAAGVDSTRVRLHKLQQGEMDKIAAVSKEFERRKLDVIQAAGMTVADIRSVAVARGYEIVYLDYLQIIRPGKAFRASDRFGAVSQISMDLHEMAVSLGVLVVALSQLSRPERQARNKAPDLFSLRESGQIEQDADAVMLLYKTDDEAKDSPRKLKIAKNKKGFAGGFLEMDFDGATQTFREMRRDHEVQRELVDKGRAVKQALRSKAAGEFVELTGDDPKLPF